MRPGVRPGYLVAGIGLLWQCHEPLAYRSSTQLDIVVLAIPTFNDLAPARVRWRIINVETASTNDKRVVWIPVGA